MIGKIGWGLFGLLIATLVIGISIMFIYVISSEAGRNLRNQLNVCKQLREEMKITPSVRSIGEYLGENCT